MLIIHLSLAAIGVAALALRPQHATATALLAVAAAADLALGASAGRTAVVVPPLLAFLTAAITLARVLEAAGLTDRAADTLARLAGGRLRRLYVLVCLLCAAATSAVSLDAAVVLMLPVLLALTGRYGAPMRPLFLGVVVVANASSVAVPQGNPTNLVLIQRLGMSSGAFVGHMVAPGLAAALIGVGAVALLERRTLAGSYARASTDEQARVQRRAPTREERSATAGLLAAAAAAWTAPLLGVAPWWPFAAVVALIAVRHRVRLTIPWRVAVQVTGLLIVVGSLGLSLPAAPGGLLGLLAVASAVAVAAAIVNNLPASVWAAALLGGHSAYAASIGLAVGPLATRHGSVATMIASDMAGDAAPAIPVQRLSIVSAVAVATATALVWIGA